MQSAIVLLAAPERTHGRVMGILSACIGTQPLGSLWIGFLASRVGAPLATGLNAALAFVLMIPVAIHLFAAGRMARHARAARTVTTRPTTSDELGRSRWTWLWEPRGTLGLLLVWADSPRAPPARTLLGPHRGRRARVGARPESPVGIPGAPAAALQLARVGGLPSHRSRAARAHAGEVRGARPRLLARVPDGEADPDGPAARDARHFLVPPDRPDQLDDPRGAEPQRRRPRRLRRDGLCPGPPRRHAEPRRIRGARPRHRARAPLEVHVRPLFRRARPRNPLRGPVPQPPPQAGDPGHRARRDAPRAPVRALVHRRGPRPRPRLRARGPSSRTAAPGSRRRARASRPWRASPSTTWRRSGLPWQPASRRSTGAGLPAHGLSGRAAARMVPGVDARSARRRCARRGPELPEGPLAHACLLPGPALRTLASRAARGAGRRGWPPSRSCWSSPRCSPWAA